MWKTRRISKLVVSFVMAVAVSGAVIPQVMAQDLAEPSRVMDNYLASLVSGDTQQLVTLIDGRMKRKSAHLVLNPETYSQFLKQHYAGVQTTVEDIVPDGDRVRARVRFDFPSTDSSVIEFVLTQLDGQWKITDEAF